MVIICTSSLNSTLVKFESDRSYMYIFGTVK